VGWAKAFPAGSGDLRRSPRALSVRPACNLMMGWVSDQRQESDCEAFVGRRLAQLVAVFVRAVRQPALANELATETLAPAHVQESTNGSCRR
jgi:hypothetical protein